MLQLAGQTYISYHKERDTDRQAAEIMAAYLASVAGTAAEDFQVSPTTNYNWNAVQHHAPSTPEIAPSVMQVDAPPADEIPGLASHMPVSAEDVTESEVLITLLFALALQ